MDSKRLGAIAAIAAVAVVVTGTALACGDKLVALGGGVGFERIILSRHPGRVVLLAEPATGLAAANDRFNLASGLALAGHDVHVVKDFAELRTADREKPPDVILVDASRARQLHFQQVALGTPPTILPIAYPAAGEGAALESCVTVASGRKGMQVLQAVEKALKLRSRGLPMPCETKNLGQQA